MRPPPPGTGGVFVGFAKMGKVVCDRLGCVLNGVSLVHKKTLCFFHNPGVGGIFIERTVSRGEGGRYCWGVWGPRVDVPHPRPPPHQPGGACPCPWAVGFLDWEIHHG